MKHTKVEEPEIVPENPSKKSRAAGGQNIRFEFSHFETLRQELGRETIAAKIWKALIAIAVVVIFAWILTLLLPLFVFIFVALLAVFGGYMLYVFTRELLGK